MLSLRRFLDCAYTILVEEYQRLGIDLLTSLDRLGDFAVGRRKTDAAPRETEVPQPPAERGVVSKNQQSMAELQKMMQGVRVS